MNEHEKPPTAENQLDAYHELKTRWCEKINAVFVNERLREAYINLLDRPFYSGGETITFEQVQSLIAALVGSKIKNIPSASEVAAMKGVIVEIAGDLEKFSETYFPGEAAAVAEKKRIEQLNNYFGQKKEEWRALVNGVFGQSDLKFELLRLFDACPKDYTSVITKIDIEKLIEAIRSTKIEERIELQNLSKKTQDDVKALVETIVEDLEIFSVGLEKK